MLKALPALVPTTTTAPLTHAEAMNVGASEAFVKPTDLNTLRGYRVGDIRESHERVCSP